MLNKIAEFILQERLRELEKRVAELEKATLLVSISIDKESSTIVKVKDGYEFRTTEINPDLDF